MQLTHPKLFVAFSQQPLRRPRIGGMGWWFGDFDPLVVVEGKWETVLKPPNHQPKSPMSGKLKCAAQTKRKERASRTSLTPCYHAFHALLLCPGKRMHSEDIQLRKWMIWLNRLNLSTSPFLFIFGPMDARNVPCGSPKGMSIGSQNQHD